MSIRGVTAGDSPAPNANSRLIQGSGRSSRHDRTSRTPRGAFTLHRHKLDCKMIELTTCPCLPVNCNCHPVTHALSQPLKLALQYCKSYVKTAALFDSIFSVSRGDVFRCWVESAYRRFRAWVAFNFVLSSCAGTHHYNQVGLVQLEASTQQYLETVQSLNIKVLSRGLL